MDGYRLLFPSSRVNVIHISVKVKSKLNRQLKMTCGIHINCISVYYSCLPISPKYKEYLEYIHTWICVIIRYLYTKYEMFLYRQRLIENWSWISNHIPYFLWDVMTQLRPKQWVNNPAIEVMVKRSNFIMQLYLNVITSPCPKFAAGSAKLY